MYRPFKVQCWERRYVYGLKKSKKPLKCYSTCNSRIRDDTLSVVGDVLLWNHNTFKCFLNSLSCREQQSRALHVFTCEEIKNKLTACNAVYACSVFFLDSTSNDNNCLMYKLMSFNKKNTNIVKKKNKFFLFFMINLLEFIGFCCFLLNIQWYLMQICVIHYTTSITLHHTLHNTMFCPVHCTYHM